MDVQRKIDNDEYNSTLPRAERPKEPLVLRKRAKELTRDEAESLPAVIEAYETAKLEFRDIETARREDEYRLWKLFRCDLEEQFGMEGHPKADMLYTKASEIGEGRGMMSIFDSYDSLSELIEPVPAPSMRP